jgi:hypothetical protein
MAHQKDANVGKPGTIRFRTSRRQKAADTPSPGSSNPVSPKGSRPSSAGSSRGSESDNKPKDLLWAPLRKKRKGTYSFVSVKVLKVVYEMIPASTTRKQLHLKAAKTIKKTYVDDLGSFFPLLVHHTHLGGDMEG